MVTLPKTIEASEASKWFAEFGRALEKEPLERPLGEAAKVFRGGVWGNFMRSEGPDGGKWAPRKDNLPHPLLILTTRMLQASTNESAPGAINEIGPREALAGVDTGVVKYAGYHMTGTRKMPARPYHYATANTLDMMADTMADETLRLLLP